MKRNTCAASLTSPFRAKTVVQLKECLSCKHGVLGSPYKLTVLVHTYDSGTQEMDMGGSGAQGYPWLHNKLKANLGYMKLGLNKIIIAMSPFRIS